MKQIRSAVYLIPVLAAAGCQCLGALAYRPAPIPVVRTRPSAKVRAAPAIERVTITSRHSAGVGVHQEWIDAALRSARGDGVSAEASVQEACRSPDTAFCLACLIAGGGHFYTGETVKGATLLGIAAGGLIGGAMLFSGGDDYGDCEYDPETFECEPGGRTAFWIGAGVAAGSWVYGIIDSRRSARRVNSRNGIDVGNVTVRAQPWLGMTRGKPNGGVLFQLTR